MPTERLPPHWQPASNIPRGPRAALPLDTQSWASLRDAHVSPAQPDPTGRADHYPPLSIDRYVTPAEKPDTASSSSRGSSNLHQLGSKPVVKPETNTSGLTSGLTNSHSRKFTLNQAGSKPIFSVDTAVMVGQTAQPAPKSEVVVDQTLYTALQMQQKEVVRLESENQRLREELARRPVGSSTLGDLRPQVQKLTELIKTRDECIHQLQLEKAELNQTVKDRGLVISDREAKLHAMKKGRPADDKERDIAELRMQCFEADKFVRNLQAHAQTSDAEVKNMLTQLRKQEQKVKEMGMENAALDAKLKNAEKEKASLTAKVQNMEKDTAALNASLKKMEKQNTALTAQLRYKEATLNVREAQLMTITTAQQSPHASGARSASDIAGKRKAPDSTVDGVGEGDAEDLPERPAAKKVQSPDPEKEDARKDLFRKLLDEYESAKKTLANAPTD